jgi:hypothetical protein
MVLSRTCCKSARSQGVSAETATIYPDDHLDAHSRHADRSRQPKVRTTTSTRTECALNQPLKRPLTASKRVGGSGCLVCAVAVRVHPPLSEGAARTRQAQAGQRSLAANASLVFPHTVLHECVWPLMRACVECVFMRHVGMVDGRRCPALPNQAVHVVSDLDGQSAGGYSFFFASPL